METANNSVWKQLPVVYTSRPKRDICCCCCCCCCFLKWSWRKWPSQITICPTCEWNQNENLKWRSFEKCLRYSSNEAKKWLSEWQFTPACFTTCLGSAASSVTRCNCPREPGASTSPADHQLGRGVRQTCHLAVFCTSSTANGLSRYNVAKSKKKTKKHKTTTTTTKKPKGF